MSSKLSITLNHGELISVPIDENSIVTKKLMTGNVFLLEFTETYAVNIAIGSFVTIDGEKYKVKQVPEIDKINKNTFEHTVIFEGTLSGLKEKILISSDNLTEFSYVATASDFLSLIITSANQIGGQWIKGSVDTSIKKKIDFYNDTCYTALYKIVQAFDFEFEVDNKTINLKESIGTVTAHTFEYGQGKGMYKLGRKRIANAPHYTRVYGFGGSKNIPYTYRDRSKRLIFQERYLDKEISTYGYKEGIYINEDIYPQRTSTLTSLNLEFEASEYNANNSYFVDTTLNFDINAYLVEGLTAKIVFKSGELSGYEYEIWKYEADTKRMYINALSETDGFTTPNQNLKPAVGDEYTLVNIEMPTQYVIAAEAELKAATQRYLDDNCVPKTMYELSFDPKYIKDNAINLKAGDVATIKDIDLGVDRLIRIVQISYPVVNPYKIKALISDEIPYLQRELDRIKIKRTTDSVQSVSQNIVNEVYQTSTTNTTIINEPQTIEINGRKFRYIKDFDNTNLENLEVNDLITGNYWDRFTYVKKWKYLGGNIQLRNSWDEIETLEKEIV